MYRIILASASPRRKELLEQIGLSFEICVSDAEEIFQSEVPKEIVKELALMKAMNVAGEIKKTISDEMWKDIVIIGADTIVVSQDVILGKPKDESEAFNMLSKLQGKAHQVYTGVALIKVDSQGTQTTINDAVETKVFVNPMSEKEINKYISTGEPMDKAGAYGIQGKFAPFIEKIDGDYYNVVGMPVSYLYQQMKHLDIV